MRKPQGYSQVVGGGIGDGLDPGLQSLNQFGEADTFTCKHCQKIVHVPIKGFERVAGYCPKCDAPICIKCVGHACVPWEKHCEQIEKAVERRQAVEAWFT